MINVSIIKMIVRVISLKLFILLKLVLINVFLLKICVNVLFIVFVCMLGKKIL